MFRGIPHATESLLRQDKSAPARAPVRPAPKNEKSRRASDNAKTRGAISIAVRVALQKKLCGFFTGRISLPVPAVEGSRLVLIVHFAMTSDRAALVDNLR